MSAPFDCFAPRRLPPGICAPVPRATSHVRAERCKRYIYPSAPESRNPTRAEPERPGGLLCSLALDRDGALLLGAVCGRCSGAEQQATSVKHGRVMNIACDQRHKRPPVGPASCLHRCPSSAERYHAATIASHRRLTEAHERSVAVGIVPCDPALVAKGVVQGCAGDPCCVHARFLCRWARTPSH
jgi:hypothetical protein